MIKQTLLLEEYFPNDNIEEIKPIHAVASSEQMPWEVEQEKKREDEIRHVIGEMGDTKAPGGRWPHDFNSENLISL